MIAVIQRVSEASVSIGGEVYSSISEGYLVLLGIKKGDTEDKADYLAKKIIDLRIFQDTEGRMNLGLRDIEGEVLVISQFTLCTDPGKSGNRPSFTLAELPERANMLYERVLSTMREYYNAEKVHNGVFAAEMMVSLINTGPVTITLEK